MSENKILELEKRLREKRISKKDYTEISGKKPQNEIKSSENVTNVTPIKKENLTNSTLKKRGDYKDWAENWRISDNPLLDELESLDLQLFMNEKGDFVLRDLDTKKDEVIPASNISKKISSILGKKVIVGWKDTEHKITPVEIISIISSDYRPDIKKRFFKISSKNKWYYNAFTPTEYMNFIQEPTSTPKTILNLIKHLVNYNEKRFNFFINWLAYYWATFKRPLHAIVLKGEQGAGKGIFANDVITPLFGENQVSILTNETLENRFKADKFENKSFYIFEETSKGDVKSNKDIKEFIKQIITNDKVPMDRKHKKGVDVKITAPSIFFTNEAKFLEIEPSDRRFSVFLTGGKIVDTDFLGYGTYEALAEQIKKELPDFARYLYHYPIDIDMIKLPMDTPEKEAVIHLTSNSFQKFLYALKNKDLEFFEDLKEEEPVLYHLVENAFREGKIERAKLADVYNAVFDKNFKNQKVLAELKAIDYSLFDDKNIATRKGTRYILL